MTVAELKKYYLKCKKRGIEPTREGLSHYNKTNLLFKRAEIEADKKAVEKWRARDAKDVPFMGYKLCKDALNDYCTLCKKNKTEPNFEDAYKLQNSLYSA